jgi:hypothetical protein
MEEEWKDAMEVTNKQSVDEKEEDLPVDEAATVVDEEVRHFHSFSLSFSFPSLSPHFSRYGWCCCLLVTLI